MLLPRFDYRAARTVEEATALFSEGPGARYLAGGTDLLPQLRLHGARRGIARLIDLKRIEGLDAIRAAEGGGLRIGAAATLTAIATDERVRRDFPLLAECALAVGAYPLRNRATMAGNVCNGSPAADTAVALLALDAEVEVAGPGGARAVAAGGFFRGPGRTALEEGELVTAIRLPAASAGLRGRYLRLSRRRGMDLATVGVLVGAAREGAPRHRIALAAVAPVPLRVPGAERLLDLEGREAAPRAADLARAAARPITDIRGTAEYRREMVGVLVARGLADLA